MLTTLKKLWNDERGFVNSMELILIATLAVLGLIVGLATFRDSLTQELGDTAAAIGQINQSYSVGIGATVNTDPLLGPVITVVGDEVSLVQEFGDPLGTANITVNASFANFGYQDQTDVGDGQDTPNMPPPGIISVTVPPSDEGTLP